MQVNIRTLHGSYGIYHQRYQTGWKSSYSTEQQGVFVQKPCGVNYPKLQPIRFRWVYTWYLYIYIYCIYIYKYYIYIYYIYPPGKMNMEPENTGPLDKENHLNQTIIFRFYGNLRGCIIPTIFKGCCLNPKEWWFFGTPYHPFSTLWKIQVFNSLHSFPLKHINSSFLLIFTFSIYQTPKSSAFLAHW